MKSTDSRRRINLKYNSGQDFWSFYMANRDDIDYIIDASSFRFRNIVSKEDVRSHVLIELHDSNFLERYSPEKGRLNTFITSLVRGYVKTCAEKELPSLFHRVEAKQVFDANLNAGTTGNLPALKFEMKDSADIRFLRKIGRKLRKSSRKLFEALLQDCTYKEIATLLECTPACISLSSQKLIEQLRGFARKEIALRKSTLTAAPTKKNNHARAKVRDLTDAEREIIREEFIKLNGIFEESKKDCSRIQRMLPPEITVFQVSGAVIKLHKLVKEGLLKLPDERSYTLNLKAHKKKWETYNSPRYKAMEEKNRKYHLARK